MYYFIESGEDSSLVGALRDIQKTAVKETRFQEIDHEIWLLALVEHEIPRLLVKYLGIFKTKNISFERFAGLFHLCIFRIRSRPFHQMKWPVMWPEMTCHVTVTTRARDGKFPFFFLVSDLFALQ